LRDANRLDEAVTAYLQAVATLPSQDCGIAGLRSLVPFQPRVSLLSPEQRCAAASALGDVGDLDTAAKTYSALLADQPDLECASSGLVALRNERIERACAAGDKLADAGDDNAAKASYRTAITLATLTNTATCAEDGLADVRAAAATIAPSWWSEAQKRVMQWGVGILWVAALLFAVWVVLRFVTGWAVRVFNRLRPSSELVHLVPRVRLLDLDESEEGPGAGLTRLLRGQMGSVQRADGLHLDFFREDSVVSGMVTSVKEIDSRLAAWLGLFVAMRRAWPWRTLLIDGQALPCGGHGEGVALSILEGAREPAQAVFWRCPGGEVPAPAANGAAVQRYFDLVPAAASWAVYEAARVGGTSAPGLTEPGARSMGYLAAGYALSSTGNAEAATFYAAAVSIDRTNFAARLAWISTGEASGPGLEAAIVELAALLFEAWVQQWPSLRQPIWGVPSA
jgi:hypothetical protein